MVNTCSVAYCKIEYKKRENKEKKIPEKHPVLKFIKICIQEVVTTNKKFWYLCQAF